MEYNVDFVFHGHWNIDIEAESKNEAIDIATEIFEMLDVGVLWDFDGELYSVEDEDGNCEYFDW